MDDLIPCTSVDDIPIMSSLQSPTTKEYLEKKRIISERVEVAAACVLMKIVVKLHVRSCRLDP